MGHSRRPYENLVCPKPFARSFFSFIAAVACYGAADLGTGIRNLKYPYPVQAMVTVTVNLHFDITVTFIDSHYAAVEYFSTTSDSCLSVDTYCGGQHGISAL